MRSLTAWGDVKAPFTFRGGIIRAPMEERILLAKHIYIYLQSTSIYEEGVGDFRL